MSKRNKWILIGAGIFVVVVIIAAVASTGSKNTKKPKSKPTAETQPKITAPAKESSGKVKVDANGTATHEAVVGGDVVWSIVVTNTGTKDVENLEANTDFGGLQLVSIEPQPTAQPIQDVQNFGPLKIGQSVTINYNLLATKVGVAEGLMLFYEKGSQNEDMILKPQTIVR